MLDEETKEIMTNLLCHYISVYQNAEAGGGINWRVVPLPDGGIRLQKMFYNKQIAKYDLEFSIDGDDDLGKNQMLMKQVANAMARTITNQASEVDKLQNRLN